MNPLVLDGHVGIAPSAAIWVSPIIGIVPALLYLLIGLALRAWRRRSVSAPASR